MAPRTRCGTLVGTAMAAPVAILIAAAAGLLAAAAFGIDPLWHSEELTLSEAAALRDDGEVVRLILAGHDPNRRYPVQRDFLDHRRHVITPLEAAVRIRRVTMVELLIAHGARPDANTWKLLRCSPQDRDTVEVRSVVERSSPGAAPVSCDAAPE